MRVVCPACKTEYTFSKLSVLKLLRRPTCERCGANLLEKLKEETAATSGQVACPRCAQQQEPAQYCKWCGAPLGRPAGQKRALPLEFPLPGKTEAPGRPSGLRRWAGFLPLILFIIVSAALSDLPREIYDAYKVSAPMVKESKKLREVLGGPVEYGPIPVFFRKETDVAQGTVSATLYLWVKGPRDSTLVSARLKRPFSSPGQWTITEGSSFKGPRGKEVPLLEREAPKPPTGSGKT
jgi:hypothetical protein